MMKALHGATPTTHLFRVSGGLSELPAPFLFDVPRSFSGALPSFANFAVPGLLFWRIFFFFPSLSFPLETFPM